MAAPMPKSVSFQEKRETARKANVLPFSMRLRVRPFHR